PSITVSPDGATVYVAGDLARAGFNDYLVIAYNAATGAQLWLTTPITDASVAQFRAVTVSPDSKTVYVTGRRDFFARPASRTLVTVAPTAATAATVWTASSNSPPHVSHTLTSIVVSPDGSRVFIAGSSGIIAYDAASGIQLWMDAYKQAYGRSRLSLAV